MSRHTAKHLHFGAGPNKLPWPWENYDSDIDIRKRLPMSDSSASFILAEHVIEHVEFREGLSFLGECRRVLIRGGVLRLAFPDITRPIDVEAYRASFLEYYDGKLDSIDDVRYSILTDWDHKSCWTQEMAKQVLLAAGFRPVMIKPCGFSSYSELAKVVDRILRSETTALEAVRP